MDMEETNPKQALKELALQLFEINAFKFGDFKMKVGINSPVYFDLRVIVSYPHIMFRITDILMDYINDKRISAHHICGVPYTALPIATTVSVLSDRPMLIRRKEAKMYGTKKVIEGHFKPGDTCIIIEDVITSGSSVLDTYFDLEEAGIVVKDVIVIVDREQGGARNLADYSVKVHSLFTLSSLMETLSEANKVPRDTVNLVNKYISEVQIDTKGNILGNGKDKPVCNEMVRWCMSFEKRAGMAKCELARQLFELMTTKKTNLCLAVDLKNSQAILEMADKCGPFICLLKTHVDILSDFSESFIGDLVALAKKHNFLLMEDRKFADIGHTVSMQCHDGLYRISSWADFVTVHATPGPGIIQALRAKTVPAIKEENGRKLGGVFIVAEMSTHGNLINERYKELASEMATADLNVDFVAGLVCQTKSCITFPGLIQLTPGVKLQKRDNDCSDELDQQYFSPEYVIMEKGADVCVVGRGILQAKCPASAASLYRDRLWAAYEKRITTIVPAKTS